MKKICRFFFRGGKWLFPAVVLLFFGFIVSAASSGIKYPSSGANVTGTGTIAWTNPSYITADDTNYATGTITASSYSNYLQGTGYGFAIPTGATINGIQLEIMRQASNANNIFDVNVHLVKSGSIVGSNHASGTAWATTMITGTYGSTSDLRGTTRTRADINRNNFGASLSVRNSHGSQSRTASVDYLAITVTYTPDTTPPTFSGITSGAYYSGNVTITFSDSDLSGANLSGAILSGLDNSYYSGSFHSGSVVTGTGKYVFTVYDIAGNSSGAIFTIDKTHPTFAGIVSGSYYTGVTISFSDANLSGAILSGLNTSYYSGNFQSGVLFASSGRYIFTAYDKAGNSTGAIFAIDITPPTFAGVVSGGYYSGNVTITFSDMNLSGAILSGLDTSYYSGTFQNGSLVTGAGRYVFTVYDNVGYSTGAIFTIDTTAPVFSGFTHGTTYNTGVSITFSDNNPGVTALLNGFSYTNGTIITGANTYTFSCTDAAGNTTGGNFTITYAGVTLVTGSAFGISADKAANSISGSAYTTLSNIIITEGSSPNFSEGTGVTLILTAPTNRRFKPGVGTVTYMSGTRNIQSGSIVVTDSTITTTFDIVGTDLNDSISIVDIQVQAITGNIIPSTGTIFRTCANPGTANIFGITCNSTSFYAFSQAVGTAVNMITTLPGQTFIDGVGNSGTALNQTAGTSFEIVKLTAVDQFMHIVSSYSGNKIISYSGAMDGIYTTGVSFTNGQSTTSLITNLTYQQTGISIIATDGFLAGIASSVFDVIDIFPPTLTAVHIQSDNSYSGSLAKSGDTITIIFTGSEILTGVSAIIDSSPASVTNIGDNMWKAEYLVTTGSTTGLVSFLLSFSDLAGVTGTQATTTDSSTVYIDINAPTAIVAYVPLSGVWTSGNIVATLTGYEEPIIVTNTSGGSVSYTFTTTGSFTFQFRDLAGNTGSVGATGRWIDRENPVVTISGGINAILHIGWTGTDPGATWIDPGATWIDNVNGSGFISQFTSGSTSTGLLVSGGDYSFTSLTGLYYLEYGYTDSAGNYGSAIRTVTIEGDTGFSLNALGDNPYYIELGSGYTELGARWFDTVDGTGMVPETGIVSTVNTGVLGSYTVTYTRVNSRGTTGSVVRDVIVQDTILPTASIIYDITGWTFTDVVATLTGFSEAVTGLNVTGHTFTGNGQFIFTFYDLAGNTGYATGNVTWIDKISPTFSGITSGSLYDTGVAIYFSDNISGVSATINGDNYISGTPIVVDGYYTFVVTDLAGNFTGASFIVSNTPVLTSVHIVSNNSNSGYAKIGDLITLSFTGSQELTGVSATINGHPVEISGSDMFWMGSYIMSGGDTEGAVPFTIDFRDLFTITGMQVTGTTDASYVIFDKTLPTFTGVEDGGYYNTGIRISFSDENTGFSATLNGNPYMSGTLISGADNYTFILTDAAGNITGADFTINYSQVGITPGDTVLSADKAVNSLSGSSYSLLSNNIIFNEGSPSNFAEGTGTLILTAPTNRRFRAGSGDVSCQLGVRNIKSCTVAVTDSTLTLTFFVSGTNLYDSVSVYNIYVQAITGNIIPSTGNILRTCANPGTANIFGIDCDSTSFGTLSQTVGAPAYTIITLSGQEFVDGVGNSGTALDQYAGESFDLVKLTAVDQYFHIVPSYVGTKKISYSGHTGIYTTGASFTNGQSTTALPTILFNGATSVTISATLTDGFSVPGIASSSFDLLDTTAPIISLSGSNPQIIEIGSGYVEFGATAYDTGDGGDISSSIVIDSGAVNISSTGSYLVTYDITDAAGNTGTQITRTVTVVDTTKPILTLSGSSSVTIEVGSSYTDAGATANDHFYGDISSNIITSGSVNTLVTGSYLITYNVTDANGNTGVQITRTVHVTDTQAPILTLSGANPQYILLGSGYVELGASAYDTGDGDLTLYININTGAVNTLLTGSYTVTYSVSDSSGNPTTGTRTVNVISHYVPIITLLGSAHVTLEVGSSYTDAGATASDVEDGDITSHIVTSGTVDTNTVDTYFITYDVSDSSGNAAIQVVRTIDVVDTTAPVITLSGANPQTIMIGSPYVELGASAYDTGDGGDISSSIIINSGTVNVGVAGTYYVIYSITDLNGNIATGTRTVDVVDIIPVVSNVLSTVLSGTAVQIQFTTNISALGYVRYGIDMLSSLQAGTTGTDHVIVLSGLTHNTTYIYRVFATTSSTGELSATGTFTTPLVVTTSNVTGTTTVSGSVTIADATDTGAIFTTTGTLIVTNGSNLLELDLSGLSITASGTWNKIFLAPQEQAGVAVFGETGIPTQMQTSGNITTTRVILETVKVGGNVGLSANAGNYFRIKFIVPSGTIGQILKLYRSEDGDVWTINTPDATCTLDSSRICSFLTDTLSYFVTLGESSSTTATTSSGGAPQLKKDVCPSGDLSSSYYDGICTVAHGAATAWTEEFVQAYTYAHQFGITTLPTIDEADMNGSLVRSHMAKMMVNYAVNVLHKKTVATGALCSFDDIAKETPIMQAYIQLSCKLGLMGIGMNHFDPQGKVTRAQFGTVLSRMLYGDLYDGGTPYYVKHLSALKAQGIITTTTPDLKELRGYVMLMLMRATEE